MLASIKQALAAAARLAVPLTRDVFIVSVSQQTAQLWESGRFGRSPGIGELDTVCTSDHGYTLVKEYRCSTSKFGIGQKEGSNCTPLGLHRIAEKIGDGCPVGTVFKSRVPVGFTWEGMADASITTRILWLDGLEPGFNRGGDVDSYKRYIYIHGTGDETTIGRPASHGCIHLAALDLVPLYERLPVGTLVWIEQ